MKQIYYTFCEEGRSVTGKSGDGARAASDGIFSAQTEQYRTYTSYDIPDEKLRRMEIDESFFVQKAPISLRYCVTDKSKTPIVVHTVYAKGKRSGNYFSHLLTDLPPEFSPAEAISLWQHPLWKTQDDPTICSPLPDVAWPSQDGSSIRDEKALSAFFQETENKSIFCFLLHHWLHRKPDDRIVLIAIPEKIILAIRALIQCLPKFMWKNMSFSTYEKTSCICNYDITGFWKPEYSNEEANLLKQLGRRTGNIKVWNPSDRSSDDAVGTTECKLEQFIVTQCLKGDFKRLDDFWAGIPGGFGESLEYLEIYYLATVMPSQLTVNQLAKGLHNPGFGRIVAEILASDEKLCKKFVEEWFTEESANSRLQILLDNPVELPLLRKCLADKIKSGDIGFIKKFLVKPPSPKIFSLFQEDVWNTLAPEKLDRVSLNFLRPYAFSWFKTHNDPKRMEAWSVMRFVEDLAEALKPRNGIAITQEYASNLCFHFCFSNGSFDREKTLKLADCLWINQHLFVAAFIVQLCKWSDENLEPLKTFVDSILQKTDGVDNLVVSIVDEIDDAFSQHRRRMSRNYMYFLDKIAMSQTLQVQSQLLFSKYFSEEQNDLLIENWIKKYGLKNIRQNKDMRNFVINCLKKKSKIGCLTTFFLLSLFLFLSKFLP